MRPRLLVPVQQIEEGHAGIRHHGTIGQWQHPSPGHMKAVGVPWAGAAAGNYQVSLLHAIRMLGPENH